MDPKLIDDLAQRISGNLPSGLKVLQDDLKRNLRAGLEGALSHLDLVTREELDVQSAVLARTRLKLEALERQVADLERRLAGGKEPSQ